MHAPKVLYNYGGQKLYLKRVFHWIVPLLGISPEQKKLDVDAEVDRLVDDVQISYHDIAEVCLTIHTTENQILSARTGEPLTQNLQTQCYIDSCLEIAYQFMCTHKRKLVGYIWATGSHFEAYKYLF